MDSFTRPRKLVLPYFMAEVSIFNDHVSVAKFAVHDKFSEYVFLRVVRVKDYHDLLTRSLLSYVVKSLPRDTGACVDFQARMLELRTGLTDIDGDYFAAILDEALVS
jgi:hypothetical protein